MFQSTKPFMRSNAWITSLNIWSSFAKFLVQQCSRYLSIKLVASPHQTGGAKRLTAKKNSWSLENSKKLASCLGLLLSTNLAWCREKPILASAGWPSTWSCWAPTIASMPSSTLALGWPGQLRSTLSHLGIYDKVQLIWQHSLLVLVVFDKRGVWMEALLSG